MRLNLNKKILANKKQFSFGFLQYIKNMSFEDEFFPFLENEFSKFISIVDMSLFSTFKRRFTELEEEEMFSIFMDLVSENMNDYVVKRPPKQLFIFKDELEIIVGEILKSNSPHFLNVINKEE
jgi:hypothetical protein